MTEQEVNELREQMTQAAVEAAPVIGLLHGEHDVRIWQKHYILGKGDYVDAHERIILLAREAFAKGKAAGPFPFTHKEK